MHGTFYSQKDRPDYKTPNAFSNDDWIIGVFGTANTAITSIGFNTSKGLVLGSARNSGEISPDWRKKMKWTLQLAIKNGF
jgi:hypothetical protein